MNVTSTLHDNPSKHFYCGAKVKRQLIDQACRLCTTIKDGVWKNASHPSYLVENLCSVKPCVKPFSSLHLLHALQAILQT